MLFLKSIYKMSVSSGSDVTLWGDPIMELSTSELLREIDRFCVLVLRKYFRETHPHMSRFSFRPEYIRSAIIIQKSWQRDPIVNKDEQWLSQLETSIIKFIETKKSIDGMGKIHAWSGFAMLVATVEHKKENICVSIQFFPGEETQKMTDQPIEISIVMKGDQPGCHILTLPEK